jgi:hypothetical protein
MSSQDTPLAVRNFDDRPEDELVKRLDWDSHQDPDDQLAGEAAPKGRKQPRLRGGRRRASSNCAIR